MSVVEIHPEELFDRLADGTLSELERERLSLHLKSCAVCRFEYGARLDFEREARASEQRIAPSLQLRPPPRTVAAPPRPRSRLLVWGIAAAMLISASGALASALGKPPWRAVVRLVSPPDPVESSSRTAKTQKRRATEKAVPVPAGPPPSTTLAPPAETPVFEPPAAVTPSKGRTNDVAKTHPVPPSAPPIASDAEPADKPVSVEAAAAPPELSGAAKLFAEANQARRAGQVGRASGLYHLLQDQYPGSPEAELSRVTLATLLLNAGDARGALAGFERYLAGPSRALEAEALVGRARALQRLGSRQLEATAWHEVARRFPGSIYARQATERLTALGPP